MIKDKRVTLTSNQMLNDHYYLLEFEDEYLARELKPGQFLNLKIPSEMCFLRRPFSVFDIQGKSIQILYMIVGKGTERMAAMQPGDVLDALGPLGQGFALPSKDQSIFILAGGTGIGSIYFLYQTLQTLGYSNLTLACGFRAKEYCLTNLGEDAILYTDDGSLGRKGYVTDLLEEVKTAQNPIVYACGPHGMFKTLKAKAPRGGYPIIISLEEVMACGIGVCLGCVIETDKGYQTVCKDGPTFELEKVQI